jgi:predicted metal-dependent hydrolase
LGASADLGVSFELPSIPIDQFVLLPFHCCSFSSAETQAFERSQLQLVNQLIIQVNDRPIQVQYHRRRQARRYHLYVPSDGRPRLTIPGGGSMAHALEFLAKHRLWLLGRVQHFESAHTCVWTDGSQVYFRGELVPLRVLAEGNGWRVEFGDQALQVEDLAANLRPLIEVHLRCLAETEFPPRVFELAAQHNCPVRKVIVRNQRTRWGSCSRAGVISLNWRLVQAPGAVRDYLILHELMHLREMNHSKRYWRHVESVCPDFRQHEQWLRKHNSLLR